jgi:dihydrofolate synthase/folylpolyglutamate synthase
MCASVLRAAGLKVGLYTSPHLQDMRERIRVLTPADSDGRISQEEFCDLVDQLPDIVPHVPGITWFELVTAIGFLHFANQQVDVAVVEVGLGGRLDATNAITPLVSAITSLSLDHTGLLGDRLELIAAEKGGIIKPGVPVVSANQRLEAMRVLKDIAARQGSTLTVAGRDWQMSGHAVESGQVQQIEITRSPQPGCAPVGSRFQVPLAGDFQRENALVAIAALCQAGRHFPSVTLSAIQQGLAQVFWPGRLQTLRKQAGSPAILIDCAHNPDSAARLVAALQADFSYERLWFVLGFSADKNIHEMLGIFLPAAAGSFITGADHPRRAAPEEVAAMAAELGYSVVTYPDVVQAVMAAVVAAGPDDLICITGSIFVVGDLLNRWDSLQSLF